MQKYTFFPNVPRLFNKNLSKNNKFNNYLSPVTDHHLIIIRTRKMIIRTHKPRRSHIRALRSLGSILTSLASIPTSFVTTLRRLVSALTSLRSEGNMPQFNKKSGDTLHFKVSPLKSYATD